MSRKRRRVKYTCEEESREVEIRNCKREKKAKLNAVKQNIFRVQT